MRALFDVNVLLALFDAGHQFHDKARGWLSDNIEFGWASCPITQNGFVRVISQTGYPNRISPAQAIERLGEAAGSLHHEFWSAKISVVDGTCIDHTRIHGPKQLTDVYLLALAVKHGGRFVTFDDAVPLSAAKGATQANLVVL